MSIGFCDNHILVMNFTSLINNKCINELNHFVITRIAKSSRMNTFISLDKILFQNTSKIE